jgi:chromosome segregation ATPase
LENAKNKFSKDENNMHTEFNKLLSKLEQNKKLLNKIDSYEQDLNKLKEIKQGKNNELSNNKELQDKCKKSTDELKKYEQNILMKSKKQSELALKIEDLQEKRNNIKLKFESIQYKKDSIDNKVAKSSEINKKNSQIDKKVPK